MIAKEARWEYFVDGFTKQNKTKRCLSVTHLVVRANDLSGVRLHKPPLLTVIRKVAKVVCVPNQLFCNLSDSFGRQNAVSGGCFRRRIILGARFPPAHIIGTVFGEQGARQYRNVVP